MQTRDLIPGRVRGFCPFGLMLGGLLFGASLTPSLIPREAAIQGLLGGGALAIGYALTRWMAWIWSFFGGTFPSAKWNKRLVIGLGVFVVPCIIYALVNLSGWQNGVRVRMEMPLVASSRPLVVLLISSLTFFALVLVGRGFAGFSRVIGFQLKRVLPHRAADTLGLLLAVLTIALIVDRGVIRLALQASDESFEQAQKLLDTSEPPPQLTWQSGSPASLIDWELMGAPGRKFVKERPTADDIADFSGKSALAPLRVYVGRAQAETAEERAGIALAELRRIGGFDRKILIIASTTGTGWLDPAGHDPVEYLHDGDIATVAVQYSYLPSALSLLFETPNGSAQADATFDAIYTYWTSLPNKDRPALYLHGLSLGAHSSMSAYNIYRMIDDPIDGALWVGPPFPSAIWKQATKSRNADSPYVLPVVREGKLVRFANQNGVSVSLDNAEWGRMRLMFLQQASDPIVFFDAHALLRKPEWMREPAAHDVSESLFWTPIISQLQLGVDLALSKSPPEGYGHNYLAENYIDGWIAVTAPQDWSSAKTKMLKRWCALEWGLGRKNAQMPSGAWPG